MSTASKTTNLDLNTFRRGWFSFIIVIIFIVFFLVLTANTSSAATDCAAQTDIPQAECEALIALYTSTNGSSWTNNSGWNVSQTPCSWYGVTCNGGFVTQLNLGGNQLNGSIPTQLGNFTDLQYLHLGSNSLTGTIPTQLSSLTDLQVLFLYDNQLSGSIPSALDSLTTLTILSLDSNQLTGSIPAQLGNLSNLQTLDLHSNELSGTIPISLGNLEALEILNLSSNQLSGSIPPELSQLNNLLLLQLYVNQLSGSIPPELGLLNNLQWLELYGNQLSGDIPTQLGGLASLQRLELNHNQLSGSIPIEIGNLANLQYLNLGENQLTGGIPIELGNLANLQYLRLDNNQLSGSIPAQLGSLLNLQTLDLNSNFGLSGTIPSQLGNLTNLQTLYLWRNQLSGGIPLELGNLANLQYLNLGSNQLSGNIPIQLGNLANLQILYLDDNQLSGGIPTQFGSLSNLTTLSLSANQLDGSIPTQIGNLIDLDTLLLWGNQLSGDIPTSLTNLTAITYLELYYNLLTASDPTLLTYLSAKHPAWADTQTVPPTNVAAGSPTTSSITVSWIPIAFTAQSGYYEVGYSTTSGGPYTLTQTASKSNSSLEITGLSEGTSYYFVVRSFTPAHASNVNALTSGWSTEVSAATQLGGPTNCATQTDIPQAECEALVALYTSTNGPGWTNNTGWNVTQSPCSWYGVTCEGGHVTWLNLGNNQLSGGIPSQVGNLGNLQQLNLRVNQLSGSIPPEIGNLTNLQRLDLGDNQLSGNIPPEVGSLLSLQEFNLGYNYNLTGSIPPEIGNLTNLQSLYLSDNQLSGSIPPELSNLANLQALGLGLNPLSGSIPPELGNLVNLQFLALSTSQLTGSIPPELGNLTNLHTLWLSDSHLTGNIPPELGNLTNLERLDLGWNQLTGSIPSELGNLNNLQYLDLGSNQLNGDIPISINNLANLQQTLGVYRTDFSHNMLRATDPSLIAFLNGKDPDWADTQTVPPTNVLADSPTTNSVIVSWSPIVYTADGGYYEVGYSTAPGGLYTIAGQTANKFASSFTVTGLSPDTTYYLVVRTFTPSHPWNKYPLTSAWSAEVTSRTSAVPAVTEEPTPPAPPPIAVPDTPDTTVVTITDTIGNPIFQWTDSGASAYQLFVGSAVNGQYSGNSIFFVDNLSRSGICDSTVCRVRLTDIDPLAWLYNGEFMLFLNTAGGAIEDWKGPYHFVVDVPAPAASTVGEATNVQSTRPTLNWNLPGDAAKAAFFQLYIAPADNLSTPVVNTWLARNDYCGSWQGTTCTWVLDVSLQPGKAYHVYMRSWGAGGYSTGGLANTGWSMGMFNVGGTTPALPDSGAFDYAVNGEQVTISFPDDPNTTSIYFFIGNVGVTPIVVNFLQDMTDAHLGCNGTTCTFTPSLEIPLTSGTYTVYVQPKGTGGPRGDGILNLGWFDAGTFTVP